MSIVTRRREVLAGLGAGALAAGLAPRARAADTVTVLNWQGYGTDEAWAVQAFARKTGVEVVHDYFNAEAEMVTKLRTNPGAYDVVLINSARIPQVAAEGLIDPADLAAVPNAAGLSAGLREHPNLAVDGRTMGVAWVWGMNALGVRRGAPRPDSFADLGDAAFAGRVAHFDDAVTAVMIGALLTGQDPQDPADLAKAGDALKALKPGVKLLWSSEDQWNKAFAAGEFDLSVYWSGASVRSQRTYNLPVDFVVPEEGAIGWLDSLAIPATSERKIQAAAFIDWMISPDFYVEWATRAGAPASASDAAMARLPADDLNRKVHDPSYLPATHMMSPLPDERREAWNNLWQEVKAHYAA
jgi:spermidine/putrescine transport system substrate-binding protein